MKTAKPLMEEISVEDYKAMKCKRKAPGQTARGTMNRTEAAWAEELKTRRWPFWFEAVTLKIGHDCRYTPDFCEWDGIRLAFYEVKGFRREDAMVKIRAAATRFPQFCFFLIERKDGEWKQTHIPAT